MDQTVSLWMKNMIIFKGFSYKVNFLDCYLKIINKGIIIIIADKIIATQINTTQ